ncbi:MAG: NADH-quinone oxidoreductase subunit J [Gemmatimonadota bacterium]
MTGADLAFWVLAVGAVVASLLVVTNRNPVACVLYLVVAFFCLAGLFVTLHSHFLAAIQVLIYAGAIMVLFLFVVMLLDLGRPQWFDVTGLPLMALTGLLGAGFLAVLLAGGLSGFEVPYSGADGRLSDVRGSTEAIGTVLYTEYFIPFMATALLLLVAMVGALVIAARER